MTPKEIRDELIDIAGRTHDKALDERVRRLADKVCPPEKKLTADIAMNTVEALICAHCERDCVPTAPCKGHKPMFDIIRAALDRPTLTAEAVEEAFSKADYQYVSGKDSWRERVIKELVGMRPSEETSTLTRKMVEDAYEYCIAYRGPHVLIKNLLADQLVGTPLPKPKEVDDEAIIGIVAGLTTGKYSHVETPLVLDIVRDAFKEASRTGMSLAKPKEVSDAEIEKILDENLPNAWYRPNALMAIREALLLQGTKVAERHPE